MGNLLPSTTTTLASTPVSDGGSTTCWGTSTREERSASLYQLTRHRLAASAASGSTPFNEAMAAAGAVAGWASWAKVGSGMRRSAKRLTALSYDVTLTNSAVSPRRRSWVAVTLISPYWYAERGTG